MVKRQLFTLFIIALASRSFAQLTAIDFTANDCNNIEHHLFAELDSGKVIVICWVMPCETCTGIALSSYNVVESFDSSNPNTVQMYLCDDFGDTPCSLIDGWANSRELNDAIRFSSAAIKMSDFGFPGMPKVAVLFGHDRRVIFASDYKNDFDATALKNAIDLALNPTAVNAPNVNAPFFNVVPNPASNIMEITFNLVKPTYVTTSLYNLEGRMLKEVFSGELSEGKNKIQIDVAGYAAGTYLLKLSEYDRSEFIKIVVFH